MGMIYRWMIIIGLVAGLAGCTSPAKIAPTPTSLILPSLTPIVIKSPTTPPAGILEGKVSIGPLTPVIRLDQPTPVPPAEVFTSRSLNILLEDGKTFYMKVQFKSDGTYRVELPVGKYIVEYIRSGLERAKDLPVSVLIEENKVTNLNLEIDTGIR